MNQIISRISLFLKDLALIRKDRFAYVQTCPSGVQYSNTDEECCEEKDECCGNCNCE